MSRLSDRLVPVLAGVAVAAVALGVVVLLKNANDDGTEALTDAKLAQVQATADSFNERVSSSLTSAAGLGSQPWQLTPHSAADERVLNTYAVDPSARSGFFLIDANDRITDGVLLRPGSIGTRFAAPGWASAKAKLAAAPAVVLPVSGHGVTTDLPSYDTVVAIRGASRNSVRGAIVIEQALTTSSPFELEIKQLSHHDPSSAAWFFIDSLGTVVATTQDTGLGHAVEQHSYLTVASGRSTIDKRIVFTADVPALGWRVVFREDHSQFVHALSGPLQRAGIVLVLLLFLIGAALVLILVFRLRQAREQERRLRELNRSQAEFISVVSHELRTPVAGVLGFLQTTVDHWRELSDSERLATVRRAVTNARRLQAMTRDILDTETLESGRLGYVFRDVDLMAELRTAVDGGMIGDPSYTVVLDVPQREIHVSADADRLQQVLANLLDNARKNAPPSEPITVEATLVDGPQPRVRVAVVDRGPGIDPASLDRVFQKFVRGDDTAVTGTGLGLYIARTIVEAHQGRIWCESSPGNRTAFMLELPVVSVTAELESAAR